MATNQHFLTAVRIINDVAIDVGLDAVVDPYATSSRQFVQLRRQLDIAIEELAECHEWSMFKREYEFTTDSILFPEGRYPLPLDFHYMINQTQWDQSASVPLVGPTSSQQWQYQKASGVSSSIYASFRQQEGVLQLFPIPPPDGVVITYEYASRSWVKPDGAPEGEYSSVCTSPGDVVLLAPSLVRSYLKSKYLSAKGFQTADAQESTSLFLSTAGGKDAGAPILSMGRRYNNAWLSNANAPDSGYGA